VVLKFFLQISKEEQKERLESRLSDPTKHWKWDGADLREREYWDAYMLAYEDAIRNCATAHAPWYVVPANKKWYRNLVIARTIADTLEAMNPQYPPAEEGLGASRFRIEAGRPFRPGLGRAALAFRP
jgi:polyphosphate kinase 2 (PPK2 family)